MKLYKRILTALIAVFVLTGTSFAQLPEKEVHDTLVVDNSGSVSAGVSAGVGKTLSEEKTTVDSFTDVSPSSWYYGYIEPLAENGIFVGTSPTTFHPDLELSLCQLVTLITRYLNIEYRINGVTPQVNTPGSEKWYYKYVAVLYYGGFFKENEFGLRSDENGALIIDDNSAGILESPVLRQDTAVLLARSFELDGIPLSSEANYPEVSSHGHEFIRGGMYDEDTLMRFSANIKDFDSIGEEYRLSVLKCYYSGIFAGDENGNFNPSSPLRRCEAAKLISAIMYRDKRNATDLRDIGDLKFDEEDYYFGTDGEMHLNEDAVKSIMTEAEGSLSFVKSDGKDYLNVSLESICPDGYFCEVLVSRYLYGANYKAYYINQSVNDSFTESGAADKRILLLYGGAPCEATVTFILRNMQTGEAEAVSEYRIAKDLTLKRVSFEMRKM